LIVRDHDRQPDVAFFGELDRVAQQVDEHLPHPHVVAVQAGGDLLLHDQPEGDVLLPSMRFIP